MPFANALSVKVKIDAHSEKGQLCKFMGSEKPNLCFSNRQNTLEEP